MPSSRARRRFLEFAVGLLLVGAWLLTGCQNASPTVAPTVSDQISSPTEPSSAAVAATAPLIEQTEMPGPLFLGTDGFPWWNDTVFYEVFVRSFNDSDGDGIGDLNGLIERLDYLNDGDPETTDDLGVTGLWLMPITVSPSYHGYDVVDYFQVDPDYGTNEDFLRLMEEAHARGIRVIVDLVLNHTSREHPWFIESQDPASEYRDWYIWADKNPNYRGPDGQVVWHSSPGGYYYGVFWSGMPDLNLENPAVTETLHEAARFWLADMGADGFRLDAIKFLVAVDRAQENTRETHDWLEAFHTFYKGVSPDAFTVGEAWTSTQQVVEYTGGEADIAFQFFLAEDFLNASEVGVGGILASTMEDVVDSFPPGQFATFITNHDQNRVMSQLGGDEGAARVAASMLLTSPGVPFIYYGEEIGMTGTKPDEDIRRPMQWASDSEQVGFTTGQPWRAPAEDFHERSVALQAADPGSLLNHYRTLIQLRSQHEALRIGEWFLVDAKPGRLYAFLRHSDDETLLVLINPSLREVDDYSLSIEASPLTSVTAAELIWGTGTVALPDLNQSGGFSDYAPLPILLPQNTFIIQFLP